LFVQSTRANEFSDELAEADLAMSREMTLLTEVTQPPVAA